MDAKLLTEAPWKKLASDSRIKDNGLLKALATYENLDEKQHDERIKCLGSVGQLAAALKKAKEVVAQADVVKYLVNVAAAAEAAKAEVNKAKALAAKTAAEAQKKADAETKAKGQEEQEEEETGEYHDKLWAAFQKLKSAKGVAYQFIVCDAKPCGVMLAKKINTKHKEELTKVTGSKRFLHLGTCAFEGGKFVFTMEKPVTGLARKLQDSIKHYTGKKLPIKVGLETAEGDDEQQPSAAPSSPPTAAAPGLVALAKAPLIWHQTRRDIEASINQLKAAIRKEFADQGPELLADIEKNMVKLDGILDKLDQKLSDSLDKAREAKDTAARSAELKHSRDILADYITYIKSEPLIAHIDSNPFVKINLKETAVNGLTQAAKAIH